MLDFMKAKRGKMELPAKPIILTFDDGYEDNYTDLLPILEEYGMKATVYVITNEIGQPGYLNWEQLRAMQDRGIEIGSHTANHDPLTGMDAARQLDEVHLSKLLLEWNGIHTVYTFSYPNGAYDASLPALLAQNEYLTAVTGDAENQHVRDRPVPDAARQHPASALRAAGVQAAPAQGGGFHEAPHPSASGEPIMRQFYTKRSKRKTIHVKRRKKIAAGLLACLVSGVFFSQNALARHKEAAPAPAAVQQTAEAAVTVAETDKADKGKKENKRKKAVLVKQNAAVGIQQKVAEILREHVAQNARKNVLKSHVMKMWPVESKDEGGTLLFSDSPESVTEDGILYQDTVQGRPASSTTI